MNYPGSKGGNGVWQTIINYIPPHKIYWELFLGTGEIIRRKAPAEQNFGVEINSSIIKKVDWNKYPEINILNKNAFDILEMLVKLPAVEAKDYFIYLDPPYPLSSRRTGIEYYTYELTDKEHIRLLKLVKRLRCNVAISSYANPIYYKMLSEWNVKEISTATRKGPATELIFMNYDKPKKLHDYRFLGKNFTDRQRIQRKIDRKIKQLLKLDPLESMAICEAVYSKILSGSNRQK
jgi:DNA adenine methylase